MCVCVCVCVCVVWRGRGGGGGDLAGTAAVERLDVVGLVLEHAGAVHHGVLMVACIGWCMVHGAWCMVHYMRHRAQGQEGSTSGIVHGAGAGFG